MSRSPTIAGSSFSRLVITVALGSALAPLNSTMLAVALPEIRDDFSISHVEVGWLVSAYLIAMAVAQPIGGRLGDQLGRAWVFRVGLFAFLGFSIAAAAAPNFVLLVILRTGQALTGAAVIPNGMAMLREAVPVRRLGQANGLTGGVIALAAAVGPLIGAGMLGLGSWRLLFLFNVPLVALALLSQLRLAVPTGRQGSTFKVDWLGTVAFAVLLVFLTLLLGSANGDTRSWVIALAAVGTAVFFVYFVRRQRVSPYPVAAWSLFRSRSYTAAAMNILLMNLVMYTTLLAVPFFVREVLGRGDGTTGLLLGTMSILMVILAPLSGRLADARGRRLPTVLGSIAALGASVMLLVGIDAGVSVGYLVGGLALLGLGIGLSYGVAITAAVESAPRAMAGAAAGTSSMMRYVGSIIGAGVLAGVLGADVAAPGADVFRALFAVVSVMALLAIIAAMLIHHFPKGEEGEPELAALGVDKASGTGSA